MSIDVARPRPFFGPLPGVLALLVLIGGGIFAWGSLAGSPEWSERAWRAFLQNWLLWASLAQGALVFSAAIRLTNGNWAGPVHRVADSIGACVPLSLVLFFVIWLGRHQLYHWIEHPVAGKEWWFSEGFVFARDVVALLWMTGLSLAYLYMTVRPMLGSAREHKGGGWQGALVQQWTAGWRGEDIERSLAGRRLRKFSAVLALSYGLAYSLLAIDLIMSLAPHWVSTLFPAYYAWGGFLSAVCMTALLSVALRNTPELKGEVTEARRHDLGKMIFAFSIFWMYLFWSQYIVIWYGNVPEETIFIQARLGSQFFQDIWYLDGFWTRLAEPYVKITLSAWICCWVVPFWALLGQKPKKTPSILGGVALVAIFGFWIERFVLVTPSLVSPAKVLAGAPIHLFGLMEIGVTLGFIGLFGLSFLAFARGFPGVLAPVRPVH